MTATPDRPATTPEGAGLAALSAAAYPGPWRADDSHVWMGGGTDPEEGPFAYVNGGIYANQRNTAAFIVALVNAYREGRLSERTEGATVVVPADPAGYDWDDAPERTEGAGEVALSEALEALLAQWEAPGAKVTGSPADAAAAIRQQVLAPWADRLARRALPTAGRVVEVDRVAEQVEALAGAIKREAGDDWTAHSEASNMGDLDAANLHGEAGEVRDDIAARLLAIADKIRADGSAES